MSIFIFRKSGVLRFHINSKLESGVQIDSLICYCLLKKKKKSLLKYIPNDTNIKEHCFLSPCHYSCINLLYYMQVT